MLRRRIAVLLAAVFMLAAAVPALAYEQKAVTIHYDGISLKLDGEYLTPRDVTGAAVSPFVLSGTTYLPIRAVASALGLGVEWEQETQTIRLTSGAGADRTPGEANTEDRYADAVLNYPGITIYLDGEKLEPRDVTGAVVDPFVISGTTYLPIRAVASALGLGVDWDGATKTVLLYSDPQQGPAEAQQQETPEVSGSPLGELTEKGYTNAFFGVRFAPPAGWTMTEAEDFAEAARELAEQGSTDFTLAESGLLSEISLAIGSVDLPEDMPTDPDAFYPALAALLTEENGFSLADIAGVDNVELNVEVSKFAGQDAVCLRLKAPLDPGGLGLTVYSELIFLWKAPYMMMIQAIGMDEAGFAAALNGFSALS